MPLLIFLVIVALGLAYIWLHVAEPRDPRTVRFRILVKTYDDGHTTYAAQVSAGRLSMWYSLSNERGICKFESIEEVVSVIETFRDNLAARMIRRTKVVSYES